MEFQVMASISSRNYPGNIPGTYPRNRHLVGRKCGTEMCGQASGRTCDFVAKDKADRLRLC